MECCKKFKLLLRPTFLEIVILKVHYSLCLEIYAITAIIHLDVFAAPKTFQLKLSDYMSICFIMQAV